MEGAPFTRRNKKETPIHRKKHLYTKYFSPQEEEELVTVIVRKGKYDSLFLAVA